MSLCALVPLALLLGAAASANISGRVENTNICGDSVSFINGDFSVIRFEISGGDDSYYILSPFEGPSIYLVISGSISNPCGLFDVETGLCTEQSEINDCSCTVIDADAGVYKMTYTFLAETMSTYIPAKPTTYKSIAYLQWNPRDREKKLPKVKSEVALPEYTGPKCLHPIPCPYTCKCSPFHIAIFTGGGMISVVVIATIVAMMVAKKDSGFTFLPPWSKVVIPSVLLACGIALFVGAKSDVIPEVDWVDYLENYIFDSHRAVHNDNFTLDDLKKDPTSMNGMFSDAFLTSTAQTLEADCFCYEICTAGNILSGCVNLVCGAVALCLLCVLGKLKRPTTVKETGEIGLELKNSEIYDKLNEPNTVSATSDIRLDPKQSEELQRGPLHAHWSRSLGESEIL